MLNTRISVVAVMLSLAACAAPKLDGDPQTVRIETPPPGMSVIYLLRSARDWSTNASLVHMDESRVGTTGAGVYYRMEVPPGRHRLAGYAFDQGNITVDTQANGVYFVEQHVQGMYNRAQVMHSSNFEVVDEARAREVIANIHTLPGRQPIGSVTVLPLIPSE
jgi:hypothetical protein